MDDVTLIEAKKGLAPGFLKRTWFWTVVRWGALGAMAGILAAAWGRRSIPGVEAPDPLMYTNLGNLVFWVLWLMGLVLLAPVAGRAWCGVCPIGAVNEFTARYGLKRLFPRFMRNQNPKALILVATVLLMGVYRIHHYPDATAWYLLAWAGAAVLVGILFAGRSLCAYLCPVGGMLGLYGRTAPVRCGVRDEEVCRKCEGRECVRGAVHRLTTGMGRVKVSLRTRNHPCPVNLRVWDMDGSDRCLLCMNCMRACPLDNVALFARAPITSLWSESYPRFSDTVFLASLMGFILLTFSRFWPPLQVFMAAPLGGLETFLGEAFRPALLVWLGLGLPLAAILVPAVVAVWSRTGSASGRTPAGPDDQAGLPLKVWLERGPARPAADDPAGEERIAGPGTVRGLSALYAPVMVPSLLGAHLVLALVKLNAKLDYLPTAVADPGGVKTYMAIWELGLVPKPGIWVGMAAMKVLSLALLAVGTVLSLWVYFRISRLQGRGAPAMLFPLILLSVVTYGGLYRWLF